MKFSMHMNGYEEKSVHHYVSDSKPSIHVAKMGDLDLSVELSAEEMVEQGRQMLDLFKVLATEAPSIIKTLAEAKQACTKAKAEAEAAKLAEKALS